MTYYFFERPTNFLNGLFTNFNKSGHTRLSIHKTLSSKANARKHSSEGMTVWCDKIHSVQTKCRNMNQT